MSDAYDMDLMDEEEEPTEEQWDEVTLDEAEEVLDEMNGDAEEKPAEDSGEVTITKAERKHREYKLGKKIREAGFTEEQVAAQKQTDSIPDDQFGEGDGWMSLQDFYQHYHDQYGVTVGEFLELVGGDRGMFPAAIPQLKFKWHGRVRYFAFSEPEEDPEVVETIVNFHNDRQRSKEEKKAAKAKAKAEADAAAASVDTFTAEILTPLKKSVLQKMIADQDINTDNEELFPNGYEKATKVQLVEALVRANS